MKCLRTFDSHNQLHTEGLFSRDLRGYKAVLALLGSHSTLFSSEMAMNLARYIPAEPAASHTPSGHRRETMRIHEKKNILSPLAHFVFQHHLIKVFFLLEVASVRTAISHLPSITLLILPNPVLFVIIITGKHPSLFPVPHLLPTQRQQHILLVTTSGLSCLYFIFLNFNALLSSHSI